MQAASNIQQNQSLSSRNQYPSGKEIKDQKAWQELMLSLKEKAACDQVTD